ncbi:MAG: hypothetical protein R3E90_05995 [Marinicella sp.]
MKHTLLLTLIFGIEVSAQNNNEPLGILHAQQIGSQIEQAKAVFSGAEVVTVGEQADCDFNSLKSGLQEAINSGATIIRIADSIYRNNLIIDDLSVEITGGFDTCADALANHPNGEQQLIDGQSSPTPVLSIRGSTQRNTVSLNNLIFTRGNNGQLNASGGVNVIQADVFVTMDNVHLANNFGAFGGGLAVINGDADLYLNDSLIFGNVAENGGGVHCSGPNSSILMDGKTGVYFNEADGDGGGVHIGRLCFFRLFRKCILFPTYIFRYP